MQATLSFIEEKIGYVFNDKSLLVLALTHPSYANEHCSDNNDRLEFLGDSVLGFIVANKLYFAATQKTAGEMTKQKQGLVSTSPLSSSIKSLGLGAKLLVGKSLQAKDLPDTVLENFFEALVAAIYIDGGMDKATHFVNRMLSFDFLTTKDAEHYDYKSELQVYTQSIKAGLPKYTCVSKSGPDHMPVFTYMTEVARIRAFGEGKNKSEASQNAARQALKIIRGGNS